MHPSPEAEFKEKARLQWVAYENGTALVNHKIACHKGLFDPNCPACKELKRRFDWLSGYDV
jgi:hypothetical protein